MSSVEDEVLVVRGMNRTLKKEATGRRYWIYSYVNCSGELGSYSIRNGDGNCIS
jgi:hypothetical protein